MTDTRETSALRAHPENATIFGDPEESDQFEAIKASIKANGIYEPLAIREDGTILSGHLRFLVAQQLKMPRVPVRVVAPFASYREEVEFIIRSNTDRRHLTKQEVAMAFKRLRELPKAEGGVKRKRGGDRRSEKAKDQSGASATLKARDEAAALLGIGAHEARALETVFATPGVPEDVRKAVNTGALAPTPAAKAIRTELKRQGGEIKDPSALKAALTPKKEPPREQVQQSEPTHEQRVADAAAAFERDYRELFELYRRLDGLLTKRPLKLVIGPTEHHQWRRMIQDVSLRAWREIEAVDGNSELGKQMTLTVVNGGKT